MPSFEEVRTSHHKSDSLLLDRHGEVIHELRTNPGGRRLDWTALQDISPAAQEAVIAAAETLPVDLEWKDSGFCGCGRGLETEERKVFACPDRQGREALGLRLF